MVWCVSLLLGRNTFSGSRCLTDCVCVGSPGFQKPVMLKVKLLYTVNGENKVEQINVAGIPATL
jgi:hypothetical protein